MKTDSLFYRIFNSAPALLFKLLGEEPRVGYCFESVELKQTVFRIDGVFVPPKNEKNAPIYFIEVQFQKDNELYNRLFAEIFLFLRQYPELKNWQGVIVYPQRNVAPEERIGYEELLANRVREIYLDELKVDNDLGLGLLKLIVEPPKTAVSKAKILLEEVKQSSSVVPTKIILEIIETTIIYKFPNLTREEIGKMLGLVDLRETRVYQEGLEDGRQEEASQLILKLLQRKIGSLSPQIQQQVETITLKKLEALGEALLDFNSLDNLIDWLNNNIDS